MDVWAESDDARCNLHDEFRYCALAYLPRSADCSLREQKKSPVLPAGKTGPVPLNF